MAIKKMLLLLFCTLMLQACASGRMAQELEQGKIDFTAGNYHEAFHQLYPLAIDGDAQAQYAVGFMYYYGYGVARDTEAGICWMTKSANKCFIPAKKALALLREQQVCGAPLGYEPPPCGVPVSKPHACATPCQYSYKEMSVPPRATVVSSQDVILQSVSHPPPMQKSANYSSDEVLRMLTVHSNVN
jgi:hypothetical protein